MKNNNTKITQHHFLIEDAENYGVECAVILYNFRFWLESNKANTRNVNDGRVWTYNSTKAMADLFPYLSQSQIERRLNKLEEEGILITGNYNKLKYDRTKWYSINEEQYEIESDENQDREMEDDKSEKSISQNREMESTKSLNGNHKIVKPIPDNKPDNKQTNKKPNKKPNKKQYNNSNADGKILTRSFEGLKDEPHDEIKRLYQESKISQGLYDKLTNHIFSESFGV